MFTKCQAHLIITSTYEMATVIIPALQKSKLRLIEVKSLSLVYIAMKCQN